MTLKQLLFLTISLVVLATVQPLHAQQLDVVSQEFGTAVDNRELVGTDSTFSSDVGTVYCFTRIKGAEGESTVTHIWYHNEEEVSRVSLDLKSADWRTWSSKKILPTWTGKWTVEVVNTEGEVLTSGTFNIE